MAGALNAHFARLLLYWRENAAFLVPPCPSAVCVAVRFPARTQADTEYEAVVSSTLFGVCMYPAVVNVATPPLVVTSDARNSMSLCDGEES